MISRGHFIGEVIDALATVAEQVSMRTALGLTDLNRYTEDFFKEILNRSLRMELVNVNVDRVNAPGLDLVDEVSQTGFQITSEKTTSKINETLRRVADLPERPEHVYVLIIGKKQGSYSIDEDLMTRTGFREENIWDITDLAKQLVGLPVDVLQGLYEYVSRELARVRIELEIPDAEGNFPTTVLQYVEPLPKPTLGTFLLVRNYLIALEASEEEVWPNTFADLAAFVERLAGLPRITRDFYAFLLERRDNGEPDSDGNYTFNYNRLKRICRYPDIGEEIALLDDAELVRFFASGDDAYRAELSLRGQGKTGYTVANLLAVAEQHGISIHKAFTTLDFSPFDGDQS